MKDFSIKKGTRIIIYKPVTQWDSGNFKANNPIGVFKTAHVIIVDKIEVLHCLDAINVSILCTEGYGWSLQHILSDCNGEIINPNEKQELVDFELLKELIDSIPELGDPQCMLDGRYYENLERFFKKLAHSSSFAHLAHVKLRNK